HDSDLRFGWPILAIQKPLPQRGLHLRAQTENIAYFGWICSARRAEQRILDRHAVVVLTFGGQDSPTGALDELSQETLRVCAVGGRALWEDLAVIDIHFLDVR